MSRPLAVLRPEPGAAATAARIEALGGRAIRLPLFRVRPLAWTAPDPTGFDLLLLTSANAVRHGGPALERLKHLPVVAVGAATAKAALDAGFRVERQGDGDAAAAVALIGGRRALHLCGRDVAGETGLHRIAVYASEATPVDPAALRDVVALVHSPRAAERLAELASDRATIDVAAISAAAADRLGGGWRRVAVADAPTDVAVIAAAMALAD